MSQPPATHPFDAPPAPADPDALAPGLMRPLAKALSAHEQRALDRELFIATQRGPIEHLLAVLRRGGDPLAFNEHGQTPLILAIEEQRIEQAFALAPLSDPAATASNGATPLMLASYLGESRLAELLLPLSDPQSQDLRGRTALMYACVKGHEGIASALLPASLLDQTDERGCSALSNAVQANEPRCAALIILALNDAQVIERFPFEIQLAQAFKRIELEMALRARLESATLSAHLEPLRADASEERKITRL